MDKSNRIYSHTSETSWKGLCECENSVNNVCMCCDNVTINKKDKAYIYIYI